uniref:Cytochrome P450 n=1 Tax=Oryza nivara TaxID=4536 RepID=A0A0E0GU39_ORYNI
MDKAYIAVFSIVILFLLVDYLRRLRGGGTSNGKNKGMRLPPGLPAVPIIGHLHLVKKPMHATLSRLAARHGPLLSARRVGLMSGLIAGEVRAMVRSLCRRPAAAAPVQLKRRLFELSLSVLMETIAQSKATRPETTDTDTDMSMEAQEYKQVVEEILERIGTGNLCDYLPALRWFDVFGVRNRILAAVSRRDAFLRRLIYAERWRMDDGEKKSMIAVLLTLQKTQPEVYTDNMITALCSNLLGAGTETTSTTIE